MVFDTLTPKYYTLIAADPPWKFRVRSPKGEGRAASQHYATMRLVDIKRLPVWSLAAKDSWLALWVPGPHLEQAFEVIKAWGYTYSGIGFVWVKLKKRAGQLFYTKYSFHTGMGYTTRKNTEVCLLARRGHPKRKSKAVRELIIEPLREHSRKPDAFYERARAFSDGPYLELFARELRPGWESWGDEVTKFNNT